VKIKNPSLYVLAAMVAIFCLALPSFAQKSKGPIVIKETYHDTGPILREVAPLLPEFSLPNQHEIENFDIPNAWKNKPVQPDPVLQTEANSPGKETPSPLLEFEGLGVNDQFFCNCMPPDNDGAPGTTQYMQFINLFYAVYDKAGHRTFGPFPGNNFWTGFGGGCQSDNNGDPTIRFDAAAQRWVVSQFDLGFGFGQCVAVSTTSDATGSYNRYRFPSFNGDFPDYPKLAVWPDAYYFTFNNFNSSGTAFLGANACAADRTKMLAGQTATMQCFPSTLSTTNFGMLPSDLDGATPPAQGTPNFVMELVQGQSKINMFKFHVDFANPANSTFTGPTVISVAAFTPLCPTQQRGRCVQQPTPGSDLLESLGNRLMWRLAYRNFGDHTVLLATHSIVAGTSGGVRWYEIRNPETSPTIFQSGTFAPDSQYRWMPAIAMDQAQNIAIGFSRSGTASGQFPSLVYAGRVPSDPAGTMETEVTLKAGLGSQTGGGDRWGDYSSLTVDPTDDCTFWFAEEYQAVNGGFDWHTAIGTFSFPGCGGGGVPGASVSPTSINFKKVLIGHTSAAKTVTLTNTGNATLNISSITISGDYAISNNTCGSQLNAGANCTVGVTFTPTAKGKRTGTLTFTDNAPSGTQTVALTGTGISLSANPTTLAFGSVAVGQTSAPQTTTITNVSNVTVTISSIALAGTNPGDYLITNNTCGASLAAGASCSVSVAFKPLVAGSLPANLSIKNNGGSALTVKLTGKGV
jgi:Cep192 domain 4/Abnormal spindle-like microcephaly-assoc'd, ASPM-SPD-2-Hydin